MSGIKPPELSEFYRRLHGRGLTTTELAAAVHCTRPSLTRVLNGSRKQGPIWNRVKAILTPEEQRLLHVAQSSTWNTKRVAKRPRWTTEKENQLS